jgi:hypothetical protein
MVGIGEGNNFTLGYIIFADLGSPEDIHRCCLSFVLINEGRNYLFLFYSHRHFSLW